MQWLLSTDSHSENSVGKQLGPLCQHFRMKAEDMTKYFYQRWSACCMLWKARVLLSLVTYISTFSYIYRQLLLL